jgi:cytochrome c551/c552
MATTQIKRMFEPELEQHRCIHAHTGRAPSAKMCAQNYECGSCPFDQMLDDMVHSGPSHKDLFQASVKAA